MLYRNMLCGVSCANLCPCHSYSACSELCHICPSVPASGEILHSGTISRVLWQQCLCPSVPIQGFLQQLPRQMLLPAAIQIFLQQLQPANPVQRFLWHLCPPASIQGFMRHLCTPIYWLHPTASLPECQPMPPSKKGATFLPELLPTSQIPALLWQQLALWLQFGVLL